MPHIQSLKGASLCRYPCRGSLNKQWCENGLSLNKWFGFYRIGDNLSSSSSFFFVVRGRLTSVTATTEAGRGQNHTSYLIKITPLLIQNPEDVLGNLEPVHTCTKKYNHSHRVMHIHFTQTHSVQRHTRSWSKVVSSALFLDYCL